MAERIDVIDFLQRILLPADVTLTEPEKAIIHRRDTEMEADPSLGLTWEELDARLTMSEQSSRA
jgi:putative addiction module component (TIGR02574 family)